MREVINTITSGSGGAMVVGTASGQLVIGIVGLVFMIIFGVWGAWLKWQDSKAIRKALEMGDLTTALRIKGK